MKFKALTATVVEVMLRAIASAKAGVARICYDSADSKLKVVHPDGTTSELETGSIRYHISKTFTGAATAGAVGSVTIGTYSVPSGYFIAEALIENTSLSGDTNAKINIGISTDDTDAALNNTSGNVSDIAAGVTRLTPALTKSTGARTIVMSVGTAAVNSGTLKAIIILRKF